MGPNRIFSEWLCVVLLAISFLGCATGSKSLKREPPAREIILDPLHIGLQPDRELGLTDFDAGILFREGIRLQQSGKCDRALVFYQRILDEFAESRYLSAAAFNAGHCLEETGQPGQAVDRYRVITKGLPLSKDWVDAGFRESMTLASLDRQAEAAELLSRMLERRDLTIPDRIDAMVLLGESLSRLGQLQEAEKTLRAALRLFKAREREEYLDPAPAARAEFRLAQLAEKRFADAPLRLPEEQMEKDLEAKATRLLEAQAGYLRTIRYGDPEWASAAGYRVGSLYLQLHSAMERAPAPDDLTEEETGVYRNMLAERTAVLLRKALRVFEMTLQLAERTRSDNQWTRAAREEMARVESQVLSLFEHLPEEEP